MQTRIEQCPGGLSVIIPEAVAARAGLRSGETAELEVAGGRLTVRPSGMSALSELLSRITPQNLHGEWAAGPPVGSELL